MHKTTFYTVAIGASAGGLDALIEFFKHIPSNNNVAFIVVMHLFRDHRSALNTILPRYTDLPVIRVEKDMLLDAGKVYLLVENTTLTVKGRGLKVHLRDNKATNSAVNILFESMAKELKEKAIGIILSGGGSDGLNGAKKIEEMGGKIMVQDPDSAQVTGMPISIINGDLPIAILTPADLAGQLIHLLDLGVNQG